MTVDQLDTYQTIPYGTPAWKASYHRRNAVEGVNGQLKNRFGFDRGWVKAFGNTAADFAVTAAVVAYNLRLAETDPDPEPEEGGDEGQAVPVSSAPASVGARDEEPCDRHVVQRGPPG